MKIRMKIPRQSLALAAVAGYFLLLLAGCVQADADKLNRLNSLKGQRKSLDTALNATKQAIGGAKGQGGLKKLNENHLARIAANLKNADAMRKRSEKFWRDHQAVFMEREHKVIFSQAGLDGRLCFGTPAPVAAKNSTRTNCDIGWMALASQGKVYSKPIPMEDAQKDVQNARAIVGATMTNTPMSPFAEMEVLAGPEKSSCVLMDHALGAMPENCLLDGFELLLEPEKDGKASLKGKLALVVMNEKDKDGSMLIQDMQWIDLDEKKDADICQQETREDGRCLLRVFFGDKYGPLAIRKGQFWGISVPKNAKVSCEYLGVSQEHETLSKGGDVWIAADGSKELKFSRPIPQKTKQIYTPAGCVYNEKVLKDNSAWEDEIRQTLRPAITMAVYGTLDMNGAK